MAYILNSIDLGVIQSVEESTVSDMSVERYPMSGSKDQEAIDEGNVTMEFTITGIVTEASVADIMNNFVWPIKSLQNGYQPTVIYHDDRWDLTTAGDYTAGNFSVKVKSLRGRYSKDSPNKYEYTLVIVESI